MNCYSIFYEVVGLRKFNNFLTCENGKHYSFMYLDFIASQYVSFFKKNNIKKGDRICVQTDRSLEVVCLYLACLRFGVVFVPINQFDGALEISSYINYIRPSLFFYQVSKNHLLETIDSSLKNNVTCISYGSPDARLNKQTKFLFPVFGIVDVNENDIAYIIQTSGTTGLPKGVMVSHKAISLSTKTLSEVWKITESDCILLNMSLAHNLGITSLNLALATGSRIFLPSLKVTTEKIMSYLSYCTVFFGAPSFYKQVIELAKHSDLQLQSIRLFVSGTMPLSQKIYNDFFAISGKKIIDRYGMTETIVNTSNVIGEEVPGSCGKAIPGVELRITDENALILEHENVGNIEVRSSYLFNGYWENEQKTKESFRSDGFFITGDTGRLDENGNLWFIGRSQDVIYADTGKIYAREVENYLDDFDYIQSSAVFGIPHPTYEDCPVAVLELNVHQETNFNQEALIVELKKIINERKIPKHFFLIEGMPRTASGKIQKKILIEKYTNFFNK